MNDGYAIQRKDDPNISHGFYSQMADAEQYEKGMSEYPQWYLHKSFQVD